MPSPFGGAQREAGPPIVADRAVAAMVNGSSGSTSKGSERRKRVKPQAPAPPVASCGAKRSGPLVYSDLSVSTGLTRAARRAGISVAAAAAVPTVIRTPPYVQGSSGLTS